MKTHSTDIIPLRKGLALLWRLRHYEVTQHRFVVTLAREDNKGPGVECLERLIAAGYAELVTRRRPGLMPNRQYVQITQAGRIRCHDWGIAK